MLQKIVVTTGIVIAALSLLSARPLVALEQADEQKTRRARVPAGFPIPAEAVDIEQPDDRKLECKVPGYTAETLLAYFKRELPQRGFTIMAQNPPRVTSYEGPVTLVVKTASDEMRTVQIYTKTTTGDAIFAVK